MQTILAPSLLPFSLPRVGRKSVSASSSKGNETGETAALIETKRSEYWRDVKHHNVDASLLLKAPSDFFELFGFAAEDANIWGDDAKAKAMLKKRYKSITKQTHPDVINENARDAAHEFQLLLNAAYKTLMDEETRNEYLNALMRFKKEFFSSEDLLSGKFDGNALSRWSGAETEQRAVFVDESDCIGCTNCAMTASRTFEMEKEWGRARVVDQWADAELDIQIAIEECPVDCIYFVRRKSLAVLEHAMQLCPRENPGIMGRRRGGNCGAARAQTNPFSMAESFLKRFKDRGTFEQKATNNLVFNFHDERLGMSIAETWLALPKEAREKGWPENRSSGPR